MIPSPTNKTENNNNNNNKDQQTDRHAGRNGVSACYKVRMALLPDVHSSQILQNPRVSCFLLCFVWLDPGAWLTQSPSPLRPEAWEARLEGMKSWGWGSQSKPHRTNAVAGAKMQFAKTVCTAGERPWQERNTPLWVLGNFTLGPLRPRAKDPGSCCSLSCILATVL